MDERICVICGKTFYTNNRKKKTCEPECRRINKSRQQAIYRRSIRPEVKEEKRTCVICGKVFYTNHPTKMTCGPECQKIKERRRAAEYYREAKESINLKRAAAAKNAREKTKRPKTDWRAIGRKLKELNKSYGQAVADGDI